MTTLNDVIERTRRHLHSGETRDERDKLDGAVTSVDTNVQLTYGRDGVQSGSVLALGLEELYVWERADSSVVVSRGQNGSTAAAHTDDTIIYIKPKFSAFSILRSVNEELDALSADGLYRVLTVPLTYVAGTDAYNLTGVTDLIDILSVEYAVNDGTGRWASLRNNRYRLRRDMATADFASGMALTINGYVENGPMRITYKAPYLPLSTLADDVETVSGLHSQAHDILTIGAALRLVAVNEVSRNFLDQSETRRAGEVPAGARSGHIRNLASLRMTRLEAEKSRLYAKRPVKM